jgi:hypothetical protein
VTEVPETLAALPGAVVTRVSFDAAVSLLLQVDADDPWELRVEAAFDLEGRGVVRVDPVTRTAWQAALGLLDAVVASAVMDGSDLHLGFTDGRALRVPPDDTYEAWTLAGPDGRLVVSGPGGELSIWDADTGDE